MKLLQQSRLFLVVTVVAALFLTLPTHAQDEGGEDEGETHTLFYRAEAWVAQPVGLDYIPATRTTPFDPLGTELMRFDFDTKSHARQVLGFKIPNDVGTLTLSYFKHNDSRTLSERSPGNFIYGERLMNPTFAGYDYFGQADAFDAAADTRLRDWHLDYGRPAFEGPRVAGRWHVGWRRVSHDRSQSVVYRALVPDLPPTTLDPVSCGNTCPKLVPLPDRAGVTSNFEGRGINLGLDVEYKLWKNRLSFDGGVDISLLRGSIDSTHRSLSSLYGITDPSGDTLLVGPPWDEFNLCANNDLSVIAPANPICPTIGGTQLQPLVGRIDQFTIAAGQVSRGVSSSALAVDAHLGFRFKVTDYLDLNLGFRQTSYDDVGVDRRGVGNVLTTVPLGAAGLLTDFAVQITDTTEERRSATYEGFYFGATLSFF